MQIKDVKNLMPSLEHYSQKNNVKGVNDDTFGSLFDSARFEITQGNALELREMHQSPQDRLDAYNTDRRSSRETISREDLSADVRPSESDHDIYQDGEVSPSEQVGISSEDRRTDDAPIRNETDSTSTDGDSSEAAVGTEKGSASQGSSGQEPAKEAAQQAANAGAEGSASGASKNLSASNTQTVALDNQKLLEVKVISQSAGEGGNNTDQGKAADQNSGSGDATSADAQQNKVDRAELQSESAKLDIANKQLSAMKNDNQQTTEQVNLSAESTSEKNTASFEPSTVRANENAAIGQDVLENGTSSANDSAGSDQQNEQSSAAEVKQAAGWQNATTTELNQSNGISESKPKNKLLSNESQMRVSTETATLTSSSTTDHMQGSDLQRQQHSKDVQIEVLTQGEVKTGAEKEVALQRLVGTDKVDTHKEIDMQQTVDRIVKGARSAVSRNSSLLQIRLEPPELGTLRVQIRNGTDGLHLQLQATNQRAHELLQKHSSDLHTALEAQGFQTNQIEIQLRLDLRNDQQLDQQQQQMQDQGQHHQGKGEQESFSQQFNNQSGQQPTQKDNLSTDNAAASIITTTESAASDLLKESAGQDQNQWQEMEFVNLDVKV